MITFPSFLVEILILGSLAMTLIGAVLLLALLYRDHRNNKIW